MGEAERRLQTGGEGMREALTQEGVAVQRLGWLDGEGGRTQQARRAAAPGEAGVGFQPSEDLGFLNPHSLRGALTVMA